MAEEVKHAGQHKDLRSPEPIKMLGVHGSQPAILAFGRPSQGIPKSSYLTRLFVSASYRFR